MTIGGGSVVASKARLAGWPAVALTAIGGAAWLMVSEPGGAEDQATPPSLVSPAQPATPGGTATPAAVATAATTPPEPAAAEKLPIDGLKISSQSWRRGGLGSKALVTLTLRNGNEYAVKDIEIACAFARRDGSHLTARSRVIGDTIGMKSRKTYARMLIGFVNVNASKAKCSVVAANRS
ncbi:hypothetical protein [Bradyrhizobium sp.]|uniref:hypothetical protein n=1 Tax=Bradyrhizobium sp. TaxID=376 RepID=UPI003C772A0D